MNKMNKNIDDIFKSSFICLQVKLLVDQKQFHVPKLSVGTWYKFRVASVNVVGASQFSETSTPFRLKAEPRTPSPPKNLTAGVITTVRDR